MRSRAVQPALGPVHIQPVHLRLAAVLLVLLLILNGALNLRTLACSDGVATSQFAQSSTLKGSRSWAARQAMRPQLCHGAPHPLL